MSYERTDDPGVIEHRLLELAYTTDAKITAPVLAYYAMCSIEDAEKVLDNLVAKDRISMEIADDGTIFYEIPDRQKLTPRREEPRPSRALVRHGNPLPLALRGGRPASPGLAALLSLFVPGAGQLYAGRPIAALLWFLVTTAGYALLLPGLILHLFCIASAAGSAHRLNSAVARLQLQAGPA
jgi:TM2 domain-containing membrane protein YozV